MTISSSQRKFPPKTTMLSDPALLLDVNSYSSFCDRIIAKRHDNLYRDLRKRFHSRTLRGNSHSGVPKCKKSSQPPLKTCDCCDYDQKACCSLSELVCIPAHTFSSPQVVGIVMSDYARAVCCCVTCW